MVQNIINFTIGGVFSIKATKNAKKTRNDMFYTFAGITSPTLNAKLYNFVKSDHIATKLCTTLFLHTINKNMT